MSTKSYPAFATGYGLKADAMRYYWDSYAIDSPTNPMLSPLHAADLGDLPPTLLTSAGFDPLSDEPERFAARLGGQQSSDHLPARPHSRTRLAGRGRPCTCRATSPDGSLRSVRPPAAERADDATQRNSAP